MKIHESFQVSSTGENVKNKFEACKVSTTWGNDQKREKISPSPVQKKMYKKCEKLKVSNTRGESVKSKTQKTQSSQCKGENVKKMRKT